VRSEVRLLLQKLKVTKAIGSDGISARVLRECAVELTPSFVRLYRISLDSGQQPKDWKNGRIVAFHTRVEKSMTLKITDRSLCSPLHQKC
jgi:hypothetical protein